VPTPLPPAKQPAKQPAKPEHPHTMPWYVCITSPSDSLVIFAATRQMRPQTPTIHEPEGEEWGAYPGYSSSGNKVATGLALAADMVAASIECFLERP